jgi:hypothetical protein
MKSQALTEWAISEEPEVSRWSGAVGGVTTEIISERLVANLDKALEPLGASRPSRRSSFDVADFCPDPLVFAVNSGLPRLRVLDKQIDGGSSFETVQRLTDGQITLVPRISEIWERRTSDGRRMIKTVYETTVYTTRGYLVGIARGISLDISNGAEA